MEQATIENILNKYVVDAPGTGRYVILADMIDIVAKDIYEQILNHTTLLVNR